MKPPNGVQPPGGVKLFPLCSYSKTPITDRWFPMSIVIYTGATGLAVGQPRRRRDFLTVKATGGLTCASVKLFGLNLKFYLLSYMQLSLVQATW
jgi:hypothetical protein